MKVLQTFAKDFLKNSFNSMTTFIASILRDIRMERSKIRPSDNIRTFYLARFFMEFLLRLRRMDAEAAAKRKEAGVSDDGASRRMMPLGLVGEMAEMDSVRWVVMRMKFSMDERVCLRSRCQDLS
jgi:replication fork protection complex subunit Tof1/Swi1